MKRIISLILSLIFILSLTSCAGIGDSELYADDTLPSDIATEVLENKDSQPAQERLPTDCWIAYYGKNGKRERYCNDKGEMALTLWNIFEEADYTPSRSAYQNNSYFDVLFMVNGGQERYLIYSDDTVRHESDDRTVLSVKKLIGKVSGLYDALLGLTESYS